eukprot:gene11848-15854_t
MKIVWNALIAMVCFTYFTMVVNGNDDHSNPNFIQNHGKAISKDVIFLESNSSVTQSMIITGNKTNDSLITAKPVVVRKLNRVLIQAKNKAWRGGLYGAFAGMLQVVLMMWLRTIINYQYRYHVSFNQAIIELYNDGGILRFYKGISYALIQGPLSKFGSVAANEGSKILVESYVLNSQFNDIISSALGTILSMIWRIILLPIDTCKTVLQVSGTLGFKNLCDRVLHGHILDLFQGSFATISLVLFSHYPWFYTHNLLDKIIKKADNNREIILRSSFIGFTSSVVSDICSNVIRIIKTLKQSMVTDLSTNTINSNVDAQVLSYQQLIITIYKNDGLTGLFGRGLSTRIIANGLQSIFFTVLWKLLIAKSDKNEKEKKKNSPK